MSDEDLKSKELEDVLLSLEMTKVFSGSNVLKRVVLPTPLSLLTSIFADIYYPFRLYIFCKVPRYPSSNSSFCISTACNRFVICVISFSRLSIYASTSSSSLLFKSSSLIFLLLYKCKLFIEHFTTKHKVVMSLIS